MTRAYLTIIACNQLAGNTCDLNDAWKINANGSHELISNLLSNIISFLLTGITAWRRWTAVLWCAVCWAVQSVASVTGQPPSSSCCYRASAVVRWCTSTGLVLNAGSTPATATRARSAVSHTALTPCTGNAASVRFAYDTGWWLRCIGLLHGVSRVVVVN